MSDLPTSLVETALQHAVFLAKDIGPRPAGAAAEKQALDYVTGKLEALGYRIERSTASFAPSPGIQYPYVVGACILALTGWALPRFPFPAIGLPFLVAALPQWTIWAARRRKATAQTENVFACMNRAANPDGKLPEQCAGESTSPYSSFILCAHIDSARAFPFRSQIWLGLQSRIMDIIQRVAVALALLGALKGVGFSMPPGLLEACSFIAAMAAAIWLFMLLWGFWREAYSPGAIDNASGVGVLLALAEYFAAQPPPNFQLGFLFTGAEETGAHGASAFADRLRTDGKQAAFIVLDMVGAGNALRYISADGVYFPLHTDPRLNKMLQTACPEIRPLNETLRSGDHAVFIRRGFPTAALQTSGSSKAERAYHTVHDTIDLLNPVTLEMTLQCLIEMSSLSAEYF